MKVLLINYPFLLVVVERLAELDNSSDRVFLLPEVVDIIDRLDKRISVKGELEDNDPRVGTIYI